MGCLPNIASLALLVTEGSYAAARLKAVYVERSEDVLPHKMHCPWVRPQQQLNTLLYCQGSFGSLDVTHGSERCSINQCLGPAKLLPSLPT